MKKYVNGKGPPRFIVTDVNLLTYNVDISFKHQHFKEFYEKKSIVHTNWKGERSKIVQYVDYWWDLSFETYSENPDLKKLENLENQEVTGGSIILMPHVDFPWRYFPIIIKDELREIDTFPSFGTTDTANKGFRISFQIKSPLELVSFGDPNELPIISAPAYEEF